MLADQRSILTTLLLKISFFSTAPGDSGFGCSPIPSLHIHAGHSSVSMCQQPPGNMTEEACVGQPVTEPAGSELDQACGCAKPCREVSVACGRATFPSSSLQHMDVRPCQSPHQPNLCLSKANPLQRWDVPSHALTTQILTSSPCGRQSQGHTLPAYENTVKQGMWVSKEGQSIFPYPIRTIAVAPCTGY